MNRTAFLLGGFVLAAAGGWLVPVDLVVPALAIFIGGIGIGMSRQNGLFGGESG